ncbi:hypothetical protein FRACA_70060 [Frankia canadensis]|uniref:Uncharacterized protein n=1 Tax=Frankia canadensis TaxID=1836972 RepID=A0A2I2L0L2_9ACTN|nr:hypothetical protein FRACA_70060 [Frankia canadensis]SOU58734.1 hypothetical protein FRACA_70060 [Frankia canadensis]
MAGTMPAGFGHLEGAVEPGGHRRVLPRDVHPAGARDPIVEP